ncbi:hypothetical protein K435DRAFT_694164, partial [Dendrothele bispora CBS 962.96]
LDITRAEITEYRKCGQVRPERAHYCRICNCYVIKYVDHCPVRINQCVGIYNVAPSKFFLFLSMYRCLSTALYVLLGYQQFFNALGLSFQISWLYHVPVVIAYPLTFILSCVLCFAIGIMLIVALWSVMKGETSVEAQDHEIYKKVALSRGETFINLYDFGKMQNQKLFFNIGPMYTLFISFHILPYTNGQSWARREGFERHRGVRRGEELTDDEIDENNL